MEKHNSLFQGLEDKRRRICEAAVEVFSKKSFNATTVAEIASSAAVGKGTFYLYFNSKEELLNYLLEYGIDLLISYVSSRIENEKDPVENLRHAIDAQLDFFYRHHDYFSFFIRELWSFREGLKEQIYKLKEEYIVLFQELIEEGVEQGLYKDVNVESISSGLFGLLSISSSHWILFSEEFPVENINKSVQEVFFNGILKSSR